MIRPDGWRLRHTRWLMLARIARIQGDRRMNAFFLTNAAQTRLYGAVTP